MSQITAIGGRETLEPGLYFVATPIGAARDITLRALDILRDADVIAAEDTRTLRHLMDIHGVALSERQIVAYHDHNGERIRPRLLKALAEGKSVAYASEAGTPLVADPGYQLSRAAIAAGHPVRTAPGASAAIAALTVAGLPSDRFLFAGFPPTGAARRKWLADLVPVRATLIFYESPRRVAELLRDLLESLGNRQAVVCRELTKRFEEVTRGHLADLEAGFADRDVKGEIVVLVDRGDEQAADDDTVEDAMRKALAQMSVKDAAQAVAEAYGVQKRVAYQLALKIGGEE